MEDSAIVGPPYEDGTRVSSASGWGITEERVQEAVRRIVEIARPVKVIAFGSWARGEAGPKSDLDVAVILDEQSTVKGAGEIYLGLAGRRRMSMDILTFTQARHDLFKTSINSVHGDIDRGGVILYERKADGSAEQSFAAQGVAGS